MATLFDLLKLKKLNMGAVQNVDEMTIVPLVSQEAIDEIAPPSNLHFESTVGYGSMRFSNTDRDRPAIVPTNLMVRGKGGQDHAMSGSGVVLPNTTQIFDNACCIEQRQGGMLGSSENEEDILPVDLRKSLLDLPLRKKKEYGKLWPSILNWIKGIPILRGTTSAHLRYFYDHNEVKQSLEDFAAEFEPIENQIGAIILFGGVPVGLEIMPSADHWNTYWKHLIRGCYGAELLRLKLSGKITPSQLILPNIPDGAKPEDVETIIGSFINHLREEVVPLIEGMKIKSNSMISNNGNLQTRLISTETGGGGDIILRGTTPVYISIIL